jgi:hypothetical protein
MLYLPGVQNIITDFLSHPASVPGNIAAVAVALVYFKEMAAQQNCYPKMQHLLGGTSLTIAFENQGLVGDVSTGVSWVVPTKYQKYIIFYLRNISHPEVGIANFFLSPLIANPLIYF